MGRSPPSHRQVDWDYATLAGTRHEGPPNDPAPVDLIVDYGQMQAGAIKGSGL